MNHTQSFFITLIIQISLFNIVFPMHSPEYVHCRNYLAGRYDHITNKAPRKKDTSYLCGYNDSQAINTLLGHTPHIDSAPQEEIPHSATKTHIDTIINDIIETALLNPEDRLNQRLQQQLNNAKPITSKNIKKKIEPIVLELIAFYSSNHNNTTKLPIYDSIIALVNKAPYMPKTTVLCAALANQVNDKAPCRSLLEKALEHNDVNAYALDHKLFIDHIKRCSHITESHIKELRNKVDRLLDLYAQNTQYKNNLATYLTIATHGMPEIDCVVAASIGNHSPDIQTTLKIDPTMCACIIGEAINRLIQTPKGTRPHIATLMEASGAYAMLNKYKEQCPTAKLSLGLIKHFTHPHKTEFITHIMQECMTKEILYHTALESLTPALCYHTSEYLRKKNDTHRMESMHLLEAAACQGHVESCLRLAELVASSPEGSRRMVALLSRHLDKPILRNLFMTLYTSSSLYLDPLYADYISIFIDHLVHLKQIDTFAETVCIELFQSSIPAWKQKYASAHSTDRALNWLIHTRHWQNICIKIHNTKALSAEHAQLIQEALEELKKPQ